MEQLAQTEQIQVNARQWENICTSYKSRLAPLESLFNGFQAVYLKTWPLQSKHVKRETNISSEDFYEGCCVYNGQLVMDETKPIPVHIRRLTDKFNVLDVFEECQNLAVTNNHPYILHCYGVYTEDSKLFVVTEPIHRTLETMLSDKSVNSLTTNERLQLALELAQAIQHLYREKIHHYCIHPKSIMITSDQHIKLNMVGNEDNFLYISPECLLSSQDATSFADDIYSFGIVLYRLFHTSSDKIELFHSGKWLLPPSHTDKTMISKSCYINYVNQNHTYMTFQIPEISPNTNDTVTELIKACCSDDVQKRPDINVIIIMLSMEKVCDIRLFSSRVQKKFALAR
jgi:serine/threonine protein kinase